mgnify:CR=1 FL=1
MPSPGQKGVHAPAGVPFGSAFGDVPVQASELANNHVRLSAQGLARGKKKSSHRNASGATDGEVRLLGSHFVVLPDKLPRHAEA